MLNAFHSLRKYLAAGRRLPAEYRALRVQVRGLNAQLEGLQREVDGLRILHEVSALPPLSPDAIPDAPLERTPPEARLKSSVCRAEHFERPLHKHWCRTFLEPPTFHRKQWEWTFIAQALHERGALRPGTRGLGFGVGREPLTAAFAESGCMVVATDADSDNAVRQGWITTGQFAPDFAALNDRGICPSDIFARNVRQLSVDMRDIPPDLRDFGFCWSSCALEHLGSIALGSRFVQRSLDCLVPGGIAVHTTEFNVFSNDETLDDDEFAVIYRRRDLEALVRDLERAGHTVEPLDLDLGTRPADTYIDPGPFYCEKSYGKGLPHLKLLLRGFVTTSVGLIIRKATCPP